jgi:hypothetical protein
MPAVDSCEPAVIRAFEKAGWEILEQPVKLLIAKKEIFLADLRLRQVASHQTVVVVEVKCFSSENVLPDFYSAIGQYLHYRAALAIMGIDEPVYLSIPLSIFDDFFRRSSVQYVINDVKIKLVIVDLDHEEILQWIG